MTIDNVKKIIGKIIKVLAIVLIVVLSISFVLLYCSIKWMFVTWSNLTMDELMYHLTAPLDGTNTDMIIDYFSNCVTPAILFLILLVVLIIQFRRNKKIYWTMLGTISFTTCIVAGISLKGAWDKLDVGNYTSNQGVYSQFIDNYYVDPRDTVITFPEKKRNLIYIYLESMETTYADTMNGGTFPDNCIPELTKLAQQNEDFSGSEDSMLNGGLAMPGTTWTAAAMFAQSSGIPLSVSIGGNDMDTQDSFFPEAVTIGDVLSEAGYNQTLLIGSDATFGGRRLMYTNHGNYTIEDYPYAVEEGLLPDDYYVWWGYEDEKLIQFAKDELNQLSDKEEPFNLTMLTVDTHFENGYVCDLCSDEFGDNQYANVMACSSRQISKFVKWIQQQDFYENTTIVISGDHPTMDSDFCEDVADSYTRNVYTTYINSVVEPEKNERRLYTTFDNYPTTLAAIGATIEGNRLGLGTNLFSTEQTLLERFDKNLMESELSKKSKTMEKLANIDKDTEKYKLRTGQTTEPTAIVESGEYNYDLALLPVTVSDIQGIDTGVESVLIAVWHDEDQNDLTWIQAQKLEDGSYYGEVSIDEFNYKTGEYYIHAYVVDSDGNQQCVGTTTEIVE